MAPLIDIIDDDEAVRDSTHQLLALYGYEVRQHASAEAFLSHPETLSHSGKKAACLLVDQNMPGMTGLDLLEHLRAKGDRTPALMITGRSDSTIEPNLQRVGAKLLCKPLEEEELLGSIEQALGATR